MLERDIEKAVKDYARSKGFLAYKFTSPGHIGVPDGMFISPAGKVLFMEFKQAGKKATALQEREMQRIREHHREAYLVDSVEQGKRIIDENTV